MPKFFLSDQETFLCILLVNFLSTLGPSRQGVRIHAKRTKATATTTQIREKKTL